MQDADLAAYLAKLERSLAIKKRRAQTDPAFAAALAKNTRRALDPRCRPSRATAAAIATLDRLAARPRVARTPEGARAPRRSPGRRPTATRAGPDGEDGPEPPGGAGVAPLVVAYRTTRLVRRRDLREISIKGVVDGLRVSADDARAGAAVLVERGELSPLPRLVGKRGRPSERYLVVAGRRA